MKLRRLAIAGFGRLAGSTFDFDDGLNVIYGRNEAGKSTLATAIVASLYGLGRRKDAWRPWNGGAFGTTLTYELGDGRAFEVQRDYGRDAKGVRVYDRDGNDAAPNVALGKTIAPGDVHLHLPLEAFVNASCVLQQAVEIDAERNTTIATALARALDGGPKEDAALGACKRLDDARRAHVGTPRATVNNPLRAARERLAEREGAALQARAMRDRLAGLRERRASAIADRERLRERRASADHDVRAIRAAELRARLDDLHAYRDDLAALARERARYDDVADFPAARVGELDAALYAWQSADDAAGAAEAAANEARLGASECDERALRRNDVGTLDEVEFDAIRRAAEQAEAARAAAAAAASEAAAARREGPGERELTSLSLAIAGTCAVLTIAAAIAHWWWLTEILGVLAAAAFAIVATRERERRGRSRHAARKQRLADESLAGERAAATAVAAVLKRLHVASIDELIRRRERLAGLERATEVAARAGARARDLRAIERGAGDAFDAIAAQLVSGVAGSRRARRDAASERAQRQRERSGIENGIAMLAVRRSEILRGDDEFALIAERDALAAAGIVPAAAHGRALGDAAAARIAELERLVREADLAIAHLTGELERGEADAPDLAAIEEEVAGCRAGVERIEALERALNLALTTVERLTREAHQAFARRLETYAADALARVTAGRYGEIRVDPVSLAVRVRVPETQAIVELDALSAGTRDQVYLLVRFAMARMFAEGLEVPPLLLDDPFAFWDEARIERCLPIVAHNAFGAQTLLFTSSLELAAAAAAAGARRIDLAGATAVPS